MVGINPVGTSNWGDFNVPDLLVEGEDRWWECMRLGEGNEDICWECIRMVRYKLELFMQLTC